MMFRLLFILVVAWVPVTVAAKTVVVLGDSISAAYGIEIDQSWVALLQNRLAETNPDYRLINESISGDTSAGGLARLDAVLADYNPAVVIVELGANDGLRGLSTVLMKNNLAEIIRRSRKKGAGVLLLGMRIPPNYGKRYTDLFYNVYKELSSEFNIAYIPFILEDVALMRGLMQPDGLHPNAKAQPIIAEKIWLKLRPLLN